MSGVLRPLALGLGLLLVASGCGQKGGLYLPDATPQTVSTPPAAPAADEAAGAAQSAAPTRPRYGSVSGVTSPGRSMSMAALGIGTPISSPGGLCNKLSALCSPRKRNSAGNSPRGKIAGRP